MMSDAGTSSLSAWLDALLESNDLPAAELLVRRISPDFERVYAFIALARAYSKRGDEIAVRATLELAVELWRASREAWWFFPLLGDLLRTQIDCGQPLLAERLLYDSLPLVEAEPELWLQTHGLCSLAQGAIWLGRADQGRLLFARAVQAARCRETAEQRESAMEVVDINLRMVGWENMRAALECEAGYRSSPAVAFSPPLE